MALTMKQGSVLVKKQASALTAISATEIYSNSDPYAAIQSGKIMAKAWCKTLSEDNHLAYAQSFIVSIIEAYWKKIHSDQPTPRALPLLFKKISVRKLDKSVSGVAEAIGYSAAGLPVIEAGYLLGNMYTIVLPEKMRSAGGVFYTPPALTARLIQLAEQAGVNWITARVLDPACGGGAFLAPVSLKMAEALQNQKPSVIIAHIESHLGGWEIDAFSAWLTQVFVEVALKDILKQAGGKIKPLVKVCNSLEMAALHETSKFDLVIGNPPYGKIKLTPEIKSRFQESLYGHPNLYGLFTQLSIDVTKAKAVIALLTPTSFLSGEYFKNLRSFIRKTTTPVSADFISVRKGVFDDVLQETMLTVYKKETSKNSLMDVNQATTLPGEQMLLNNNGQYVLPKDYTAPWILPRIPAQAAVVKAMRLMPCRLADWGYQVSTGPLVWNRHKQQLVKKKSGADFFPVIWAESITKDGRFLLKAEKKNHNPFFKFKTGDEWLLTKNPCILLQRTTAKEQDKRLIAAAIPRTLTRTGVVIENHLNMIIPLSGKPPVETEVLSIFLNSRIVNDAFRTISGSVAVSAYELESLPLPSIDKLKHLTELIRQGSDWAILENECNTIYKQYL